MEVDSLGSTGERNLILSNLSMSWLRRMLIAGVGCRPLKVALYFWNLKTQSNIVSPTGIIHSATNIDWTVDLEVIDADSYARCRGFDPRVRANTYIMNFCICLQSGLTCTYV